MLFICFVVTSRASSIPSSLTLSMHSDYLQDDSMSLNYNNITINDHPSMSHMPSDSACPINILSCPKKSNEYSSTKQIKSQHSLHDKQKLHKSSTCDPSFSQTCRLKKHQCGHIDEKPYKCSTCDKCSTRKSDLTNHQRIHTGERSYTCCTCGKCFTQKCHSVPELQNKMSKRLSYTTAFKLQVVDFAETNGNRSAARHFSVDESNVRLWKKSKPRLDKMPKSKCANRGRVAFYPNLDKRMLEWITDCRSQGIALNTIKIRLTAKLYAKDMNIFDFKASTSWCYRFMARHDLSMDVKPILNKF